MKRQRVDIVAEPHACGTLNGRGNHQVGAGQEGIIGEVMLGEPALAQPECFRQSNLIEHFSVGLIMGHAPSLTVVEQSEIHVPLLLKCWITRQCRVHHTFPEREPTPILADEEMASLPQTSDSMTVFQCQGKMPRPSPGSHKSGASIPKRLEEWRGDPRPLHPGDSRTVPLLYCALSWSKCHDTLPSCLIDLFDILVPQL